MNWQSVREPASALAQKQSSYRSCTPYQYFSPGIPEILVKVLRSSKDSLLTRTVFADTRFRLWSESS